MNFIMQEHWSRVVSERRGLSRVTSSPRWQGSIFWWLAPLRRPGKYRKKQQEQK